MCVVSGRDSERESGRGREVFRQSVAKPCARKPSYFGSIPKKRGFTDFHEGKLCTEKLEFIHSFLFKELHQLPSFFFARVYVIKRRFQ